MQKAAPTNSGRSAFELPRLRVSFKWEDDTHLLSSDEPIAEFFDVKFCPFQPLDRDPVFAAISKKHAVICALSSDDGGSNPCRVITILRDDDAEALACCCTWVQDPESGDPWLCVAGKDARIKVWDVTSGQVIETLVGHGSEINDLVTSPVDPTVIASASEDASIRIWSLKNIHRNMPCLCVLGGEGHYWSLLSIAFHDSGKYILSGSHDQIINLWSLPELSASNSVKTPTHVHYPHFSTSHIHTGIVDCVAFYGDLILSRACHDNSIILWKIEGFSSAGPQPPQSIAPVPSGDQAALEDAASRLTRSAFLTGKSGAQVPFRKVVSFNTPNCGSQFYLRFKLHSVPHQNPVLGFANAGGNVFFWDLARLSIHHDLLQNELDNPDRDQSIAVSLPTWLKPITPRSRADAGAVQNPATKTSRAAELTGQIRSSDGKHKDREIRGNLSAETREGWAEKYHIGDPTRSLKAHRTESTSKNIVGRQTAWSPGGEWCVVVGSSNEVMILQRWANAKV